MTAPEEVNEATRAFLREYPDAEAALKTLIDRDSDGAWTFDDVDLDSGQFGERFVIVCCPYPSAFPPHHRWRSHSDCRHDRIASDVSPADLAGRKPQRAL